MVSKIQRAFIVSVCLQHASIGWIFSTYVLFLLDRGLTLFEAHLLNFGFMIGIFLFDPPTGMLSDKFGQKKVYLTGVFFWGFGMIVYAKGLSFWHFLGAELIAAFGSCLISGSLDCWMRNLTNEEETHKTLSRVGIFGPIIQIPTAILGSIVAHNFGFTWPWILGFTSSMISLVISWFILRKLPEDYTQPNEFGWITLFKNATGSAFQNKDLRFTLLVTFGLMFFVQPFNMLWSVIFKNLSGEVWWLGSLWIGVAGGLALGAYFAKNKLYKLNGLGIIIALLFCGVPMLGASVSSSVYLSAPLFLIHEIGRGAIKPLIFTWANRHIPNNIRSTSNSIRSSLGALGSGLGLVIFGGLTNFFLPQTIWGISAIGLILLSIYAYRRS